MWPEPSRPSDTRNPVVFWCAQAAVPSSGGGKGSGGKKRFLPFDEAVVFARSLHLKGKTRWKEWSKTGARPVNIPSHPDIAYKNDGWQG